MGTNARYRAARLIAAHRSREIVRRLVAQTRRNGSLHGWDVFEAAQKYSGEEGVLDDIGDLRRYLLLVDHYIRFGGEQPKALEWKENE